ncbi:hypothetical protein ABEV40_17225, partial [Geobacillus thermocatenulatus]|uniref:hypothetical protein n=1 Tax=Geobacillus thermocatenulatus TaxID=33938 RepID=UPI003D23B402
YSVSCVEKISPLFIPNPIQRYPIYLVLHKILDGTRKAKDYNYVGLIDGTAGILLTILAIQNSKKTPWDCAFLLSEV